MKTYKLLKDLPTFKAGDEFYRGASGHLYTTDKENGREIVAYRNEILARFPNILKDWFEEIEEETKTVWDLEDGDDIWVISEGRTFGGVWGCADYSPERNVGDVFISEGDAEKELARRKAKVILERDTKGFKPDWIDDSQDRFCVSFYLFCGNRSKGNLGRLQVENAKHSITREIYFATQADAEASIKVHEKEWKIYLRVEE